ncbi:hypothetical protein JQX13_36365 [Archangium violaceum]|uniref:hypothetical protein n=1 Tax=Archangium violaceum TaxID=83451 RepID=UPI00193B2A48|nr:hypothetical protein [Archangium violaceum]QRK05590.1 hypothetical protein JQX13_36365 [Archangium violaceum]
MDKLLNDKELRKLVKGWPSDWEQAAIQFRRSYTRILLEEDAVRGIGSQLQKAVAAGNLGVAVNWGLLGLLLSDGALIRMARYTEALRASVYPEGQLPILTAVLTQLRQRASLLPELEKSAEALSDFQNYVELYRATRKDEAALLSRLQENSDVSLHALLSLAEIAFFDWRPRPSVPHARSFDLLEREAIASGVSYALEAYDKMHGLSLSQFGRFKESDPHPSTFQEDVLLAYRLRELIDLEAYVYRMGYRCTASSQGHYQISPPDSRIGMALSFGYARQAGAPFLHAPTPPSNAVSLIQLCGDFVERLGSKVMALKGDPGEEALRFQLPEPAWKLLGKEIFSTEEYFAEEGAALGLTCQELMTDASTLESFQPNPGLTLGETIRLQRVFVFLAIARRQALAKEQVDERVLWNSLLGVMTEEGLTSMLVSLGFREQSVTGFLKLFSWKAGRKSFLDLQYQPLLQLGDAVALPFFILASSNVVRNALQVSKTRLHSDGRNDPLPKTLADVLEKSGAQVKAEVQYEYPGLNGDPINGDLDVFAKIGNRVFAFECKRPLHPCSAFELRTTWDYLEEAALQLDRVKNLWEDPGFRKYLGGRLGWDLSSCDLSTCIVLSHRLMSGASFRGHPIRQIRELFNMINTGESRLLIGNFKHAVRNWKGDRFTADDLEDYLSEDSKLYGPVWKSYFVDDVVWSFSDARLTIPRYAMSPLKQLAASGLVNEELTARLLDLGDQISAAELTLDSSEPSIEKLRVAYAQRDELLKEVQQALSSSKLVDENGVE